jgi:hypothetical protein
LTSWLGARGSGPGYSDFLAGLRGEPEVPLYIAGGRSYAAGDDVFPEPNNENKDLAYLLGRPGPLGDPTDPEAAGAMPISSISGTQ